MNQADNGGFQCDLGVASDISAADEMDNTPTAPVYSVSSYNLWGTCLALQKFRTFPIRRTSKCFAVLRKQ